MTAVETLKAIVDILVGGIVEFGSGIAKGISSIVTNLMYNDAGTGLSAYFVGVVIFAAIAICVSLSTRMFIWLGTLGK